MMVELLALQVHAADVHPALLQLAWAGAIVSLVGLGVPRRPASETMPALAPPHPAPLPQDVAVGRQIVAASGDEAEVDAERLVLARLGFADAWERWREGNGRDFEHEFDRAFDHLEKATEGLE